MGNAPSSEALPPELHRRDLDSSKPVKRQPQKLSKPRTGNHASSNNSPAAARRRTTQIVPSAPIYELPANPSSHTNLGPRRLSALSCTHSPMSPISPADQTSAPSQTQSSLAPRPQREKSKSPNQEEPQRRFALFRSKSSHDDRKSKTSLANLVPPLPGDKPSRANSMNWESRANMEYARDQVEMWNVPGNRRSANYDLASYEAHRLLSQVDVPEMPAIDPAYLRNQENAVSQSTWKTSHPSGGEECVETEGASDANGAISRVESQTSLYAPMRRRSIAQTPGLATRAPEEPSASRKSSFRHSLPPTPDYSMPRQEYFAPANRHYSMPPPARSPDPRNLERVETPSDGEFKQIGNMAFGSLRITNGAASPIPSLEGDIKQGENEQRSRSKPKPTKPIVSSIRTSQTPDQSTQRVDEAVKGGQKSPVALETTSKHTALEDDLFDEETSSPEFPTEILEVRHDPAAHTKLERPRPDPAQKVSPGLARADSGIVATPASEEQPPQRALSKTDSGYSSKMSLRSVNSKRQPAGTDTEADRVTLGSQLSRHSSTARSARSSFEAPLGSPASGKMVVDSATFELLSVPSQSSTTPTASRSPDSLVSPMSDLPRQSESAPEVVAELPGNFKPIQPQLTPEVARAPSTLSIGGSPTGSRKNKLQRLLAGPGMRGGPPAVHQIHPTAQLVPAVPRDVEQKLQEHSGQFPITTKRLAVRKQHSKDTLKTILSVDSVDVRESFDSCDSPASLQGFPSHESKSPTKSRRRGSIQSAASIISRRSSRRKSDFDDVTMDALQGDLIPNSFESHVTSIDSIRSSVGRSAFDQAFASVPERPEFPRDRAPRRAMTMDPYVQREMEARRRRFSSSTRPAGPQHGSPARNAASPIPELPDMSPTLLKPKTPPPISMANRSSKRLRKKPSSRSKSTSPEEQHGDFFSHKPRDPSPSHDYPSSPQQESSYPEFQHLRAAGHHQQPQQRLAQQNTEFGPIKRSESAPNIHHGGPRPRRPTSAVYTPTYGQQLNPENLRPCLSMDGYGQPRVPSRHVAAPQPQVRPHSGQTSHSPAQSGSYYQNQLLQMQDQQLKQGSRDQGMRNNPPRGPVVRHSRTRSSGRGGVGPNPPYRVLHSYNSPAYRNAPIWG